MLDTKHTILRPPDLGGLPARVARPRAAELVTEHYFEISARTLERWPLRWLRVNGKAHCNVAELFAIAEQMLANGQERQAPDRRRQPIAA